MKNGSDERDWRAVIVDIVDLLIGACAFFVAYTTFNAAADFLDLLIAGVIALVGIGLMVEPSAVGYPTRSVAGASSVSRLAHG